MKNKNDLYEGVPTHSLMTRQHIYDNRHADTPWWKPAFDKGDWTVIAMTVAVILCFVGIAMIPGCTSAQPPTHRTLVLHITGTLDNPKVGWEYSRNDPYMGILTDAELRSVRERYERHLSLTIDTIDRQTSVDGRVRDRHTTTTRTTETRR